MRDLLLYIVLPVVAGAGLAVATVAWERRHETPHDRALRAANDDTPNTPRTR